MRSLGIAGLIAGGLALTLAATAQQAPAAAPAAPSVTAAQAAADPANWRLVAPENLLQLTVTGNKTILVELRPDFAPKHVAQIKAITKAGHYDGLPWHRVIDDFMAQGGETYAKYMLYPRPYGSLPSEFTFMRKPAAAPVQWLSAVDTAQNDWQRFGYLDGFIVAGKHDNGAELSRDGAVQTFAVHCAGAAAMARASDPNSADTQFYLMRQNRVGPNMLDADYTVWGRALTGLDAIRGIKAGDPNNNGVMTPAVADKLIRARLVSDLRATQRPTVYVQRPEGPAFAPQLAAARADTQLTANAACDLPPVAVIVEMPASE